MNKIWRKRFAAVETLPNPGMILPLRAVQVKWLAPGIA
jgi:hypothetical protein